MLLAEVVEVFRVIGRDDDPVWPGWNARATPVLLYLPGVQDALQALGELDLALPGARVRAKKALLSASGGCVNLKLMP